ncbi:MAG: polysaccharide biosynthesis/export family protein [Segetibacter sp.]
MPDSSSVQLPPLDQEPRIIQKGDRLQINIGGRSPEASTVFNNYGGLPTSGTQMNASTSTSSAPELLGYLVDEDGIISFPIIGDINVGGLTTKQLRDTITQLVNPYLKEPLVNVRFINFKFTVLGEVRSPGTFTLSQQRTTLLDALGAAGDLPRTAKRYDIQLYRDYNGKRKISKIDLRKTELLNNRDLFQIRHNDVIIVQPRNVPLFTEESRAYIGFFSLLARCCYGNYQFNQINYFDAVR